MVIILPKIINPHASTQSKVAKKDIHNNFNAVRQPTPKNIKYIVLFI